MRLWCIVLNVRLELMNKIKIIDRPCGTGKTTEILNSFEKDKKYLVIVPFLSEVERVKQGVKKNCNFHEPLTDGCYETKKQSLIDLAICGDNIVTTHKMFESLVDMARQGLFDDYHIIIDEVPEVLSVVDSLSKKSLNDIYINGGYLTVEQDGKVVPTQKWHEDNKDVSDTLSLKLYRKAVSESLYLVNESYFIWAMPKELLIKGCTVTIYTFKSSGSLLCKYLDKINIPYDVERNVSLEMQFLINAQRLIQIEDVPLSISKMRFSYANQTKQLSNTLYRKKIALYLKNLKQRKLADVCTVEIMITCVKEAWDNHKNKGGFRKGSRLGNANWVANTTRGTNAYAHCSHAIYLYDQHINPALLSWLKVENDVKFKEDYALTEFIQWLYRTRIRKGEPIWVYIPSKRMERIFRSWLYDTEAIAA